MIELKQRYLNNHLLEVEDRSACYGELADANEIVSDDDIYDNYGGFNFSEDDFFYSIVNDENYINGSWCSEEERNYSI